MSLMPPDITIDTTSSQNLDLITRLQEALGYDAESARHMLEVNSEIFLAVYCCYSSQLLFLYRLVVGI